MIDRMYQFREFTANEESEAVIDEIKLQTFNLANMLDNVLCESEEKLTALSRLKEAAMWATVCIGARGVRK